MTYDPTNRKDIRAAEKAAKVEDKQLAEVIVQLCDTTAGRRWVWNELAACHVFTTSFSTDAVQMAFFEGERNRGLQLLAQIMQHCPQNFTLAMQEANARSVAADTSRSRARAERAGSEEPGWDAPEPGPGGEPEPDA